MYIEGKSDRDDRLNALAAYITLSSVIYYAAAIIMLHILRTDFDPRYRYLSEYVNGPYGVLMTSTFFVLSLGSLALLFGLWRSVSSKIRLAPGMLLLAAWACAVCVWRDLFRVTLRKILRQLESPHPQSDGMGRVSLRYSGFAPVTGLFTLRWEGKRRSRLDLRRAGYRCQSSSLFLADRLAVGLRSLTRPQFFSGRFDLEMWSSSAANADDEGAATLTLKI